MPESTLVRDYQSLRREVSWYLGYGMPSQFVVPTGGLEGIGDVASAVLDVEHGLAAGDLVWVRNATAAPFNGLFPVTIDSATGFSYVMSESESSTAVAVAGLDILVDVRLPRQQEEEIDSIIQSGLHQFYFPPPIDGFAHTWSFLRPNTLLVTEADVGAYALPSDFQAFDGDLFIEPNDDKRKIQVISVAKQAELLRTYGEEKGAPRYAVIIPLRHDLEEDEEALRAGQRFRIGFFPIPDKEYVLNFQYVIAPNKMDPLVRRFPYGGAQHSETVLAACLMVAEQRMNTQEGIWSRKFFERLTASVRADRHAIQPANFGYNGDPGMGGEMLLARTGVVTFKGVQY